MRSVLVQTLAVRQGKVLLGRWRPGSGPFEGRLTGILGSVQVPAGQPPPLPEVAAAAACRELLGPGVRVDPRSLRRRGLFHFEELDPSHGAAVALGERYSEHQLVLQLRSEEGDDQCSFQPQTTERFEPVGWFGQEELPFDEMPEDDEVWYKRVLFDDQRLRGTFSFEGTRLLSHDLEEVVPEEGLCDLDDSLQPSPSSSKREALLLHNPDCSKSRALKEALESRRINFAERHYRKEPLSLSELETLASRLQAAAAERPLLASAARTLCRDEQLVEQATDDALILEALALQPELLQRPVLVKGWKAALGRPTPEDAMRLL